MDPAKKSHELIDMVENGGGKGGPPTAGPGRLPEAARALRWPHQRLVKGGRKAGGTKRAQSH